MLQDRRAAMMQEIELELERACLQLQLCRGRRARHRIMNKIDALNRKRSTLMREPS